MSTPTPAPVRRTGRRTGRARQPQVSTFRWGVVVATSPLRVRLDGEDTPPDATPSTLRAGLAAGDRVWCQLVDRQLVVHGKAGG